MPSKKRLFGGWFGFEMLAVCTLGAGCGGNTLTVGDPHTGGSSGIAQGGDTFNAGSGGDTLSGGSGGNTFGGAGSGGNTFGGAGSGGNTFGGGNGGEPVLTGGSPSGGGAPSQVTCPCTRRQPTFRCQNGTEDSVEVEIDAKGGRVELQGTPSTLGTAFRLIIPANAVEKSTLIRVTELNLAAPADYVDYSPVYLVEPASLVFERPVEVDVPATNSLNTVERTISVYVSEQPEGPFERLPDSYSNAGFLQATLPGAGYVFAGYPKTGAVVDCP
jgi:hypothetical protein